MQTFYEQALRKGENPNEAYLKLLLTVEREKGHTANISSIYLEIARLELGKRGLGNTPVNADNFKASIEYIYTRADCFDFILPGFIFMMKHYSSSPQLPDVLADEAKNMILGCKYWIDEGGSEKSPCYFTENHQILFHSNEYMAGSLYPDEIFVNNGQTGSWHKAHARPYILRWLDWRFRFGFCEWLSNTYYHEDLLAITPLMECDDEEIRTKAAMVADLIFFDMAVNSFKGILGSTHGRAYCANICSKTDGSFVLRGLFLNQGDQPLTQNSASILLAAMDYHASKSVYEAAQSEEIIENRQCMSMNPEEGKLLGVDPKDPENLTFYWGMQAFSHRMVVDNTLAIQSSPDYYLKERATAYKENFDLCDAAGAYTDPDADYTSMPKVNIYTYKTKDTMLSCAQDFKKGKYGFQQHIWQASLGGQAIVYTTHPGTREYNDRPNCWAGNRILPKAVGFKNVLICMYNTPVSMVPVFVHSTHAYFPQEFMDETTEKNGWYFGRKQDGYVALRALSGNGTWVDADPAFYPFMSVEPKDKDGKDVKIKPYEISANGRSNVWVCEMGSKSESGSFAQFIENQSAAELTGDVFGMTYCSPSLGAVTAGWNLPLTVAGENVYLGDYPRYDNPFCNALRAEQAMEITGGDSRLSLDFENTLREETKI